MIVPSAILFNGGVFRASVFQDRICQTLDSWSLSSKPLRRLESRNLDLAVSLGAAYYNKIQAKGEGLKIRSGVARSYYLGVESSMMAVPGITPPVNGLCVVPQGTEEGTQLPSIGKRFGLVAGQKVKFRFFSSSVRAGDEVGSLVEEASDVLEESSQLELMIPQGKDNEKLIPVLLDAQVSDLGTLQLAMKHVDSTKKWDLEFNVRSEG